MNDSIIVLGSPTVLHGQRWEMGGVRTQKVGVVVAEMSAWAGMTIEEYDEQLFAEVEAEIGAAKDSDEELTTLEADFAALMEDDMQVGDTQPAGHEFTCDGTEVTHETRWVRKDGQFQKLGLQEAIEQELENEIEAERRAEAQRTIQAYENAERDARTNNTQAERAADDIVHAATREALRILAEEQGAAVGSVSESSALASDLPAKPDNSDRPVLDDNIAPWMREMQQYVSFRASDVSHRATSVQLMAADVRSAGARLQARAINSCGT